MLVPKEIGSGSAHVIENSKKHGYAIVTVFGLGLGSELELGLGLGLGLGLRLGLECYNTDAGSG